MGPAQDEAAFGGAEPAAQDVVEGVEVLAPAGGAQRGGDGGEEAVQPSNQAPSNTNSGRPAVWSGSVVIRPPREGWGRGGWAGGCGAWRG